MKCSSERASPGGSSALSRHCRRRWVLVKWPSFSMCAAAGMRKTSVWISSVTSSPDLTSGESSQKRADSTSARSRTTSHLSPASARRCSPECWEPTAGFWPITNIPSTLAVAGAQHRREVGVVAGDLRQVGEAVVVLRRRVGPEPGLQQRDDVLVEVAPPAARRAALLDVALEREVALGDLGHRQVAGEQVVERGDVARALDRGVAAHRHDAAARAPDVAEQQLDDRAGADHLHAEAVLRPADAVDEHGRALAPRVGDQRLGDLEERLARDAAHALDHLRRVARVVLLEQLEDAARVLERLVAGDRCRSSCRRPSSR